MTRSELEDLGTALLEVKRSELTRPHPHSADTPAANTLAGALTMPLEAARGAGQAAVRKVRSLGNR